MTKNIIFDLDRTVIDSYSSDINTFRIAVKNICNIDLSNDQMKEFETLPTEVCFKRMNLTQKQIKLINIEWDKLISDNPTKLFDKVEDTIERLNRENYFLAVVTSRNDKEVKELDSVLKNVRKYFKVIVTTDTVKNPKPSSDSMEYIYNNFNIKAKETLYIGDTYNDYIFTKNSKCEFIQACWDNEPIDGIKHLDSIEKIFELI